MKADYIITVSIKGREPKLSHEQMKALMWSRLHYWFYDEAEHVQVLRVVIKKQRH